MVLRTPPTARSPASAPTTPFGSVDGLLGVLAGLTAGSDEQAEERVDLQVLGLGSASRSPTVTSSKNASPLSVESRMPCIPELSLLSMPSPFVEPVGGSEANSTSQRSCPIENHGDSREIAPMVSDCAKSSMSHLDYKTFSRAARAHSMHDQIGDVCGGVFERSGEHDAHEQSAHHRGIYSGFRLKSTCIDFPPTLAAGQEKSQIDGVDIGSVDIATHLKSVFSRMVRTYLGVIFALLAMAAVLAVLGVFVFEALPWTAWVACGILSVSLISLIMNIAPAHITMIVALAAMLFCKILTPEEALVGFSNTGVAAVSVLFVVAEGIQRTSVLRPMFRSLLGRPKSLWVAQLRLFTPVALISAFLNNTPVIAMMIPVVQSWSRRAGFPISKLLMPLNNVAILGGTVTLLGTSTNLVVAGLAKHVSLRDQEGAVVKLTVFGITRVGFVLLLIGLLYSIVFSHLLLADRGSIGVSAVMQSPREYTVPLLVTEHSPIVGDTVTSAGLRHLQGLFLVEVIRADGTVVPAVPPDTEIRAGDTLLFAGIVETVTELYHIPGLVPATSQTDKMTYEKHERRLVELVIGRCSSLTGKTPREAEFRSRFDSAIIAVHRQGAHLNEKIADIRLFPGDTLLVEAGENFIEHYGRDSNFALVSEVSGSQPPRSDALHMALSAFAAIMMVVLATTEVVDILTAACGAALFMILTGCLSIQNAAESINMPVILTIAASFGVSKGIEVTGAAEAFAKFIVNWFEGFGHFGLLCGIYFSTATLSAVITNNAAVALMFPVLVGILDHQSVNTYAALYTLMIGASSCFTTPISYQTNLMVHGPGGYTFVDWVVFGLPLQIVLGISAVLLMRALYP